MSFIILPEHRMRKYFVLVSIVIYVVLVICHGFQLNNFPAATQSSRATPIMAFTASGKRIEATQLRNQYYKRMRLDMLGRPQYSNSLSRYGQMSKFARRLNAFESDASYRYEKLQFTILGGGAFSLALVKVLADHNIQTTLLVRNATIAEHINSNRFHPKYIPDYQLPPTVRATTDPVDALKHADFVVHAVPMQSSREFLLKMKPHLPQKVPILSVTKGVEIGTYSLMNDIFVETLGTEYRTAFLSGPSFAKEIVQGKPTAVVVASNDDSLASELAEILSSKFFRCHTSRDVKGVELGGAIKNVIALAAGMCEGLDLGMNAMSSLVTRGCVEMGL